MSRLVKIPKAFTPDMNFWVHNPMLANIKPFSTLYKTDNGGTRSSEIMWSCVFLVDNDEDENPFYRYYPDQRKDKVLDMFPDRQEDLESALFDELCTVYPFEAMTSTQRSLKDLQDALMKRARFLREAEYDEDNGSKLDLMHSKTSKLYKDLQEAIALFDASKDNSFRVKGGREESFSEKGKL